KNAELRIGEKEHHQRPDLERHLDELRTKLVPVGFAALGIVGHQAFPTIARAKSSAAKVSRLSTPSPTPMKWTGRPNLRAMATRMPPRAVPSSLVITSPVTPARLPKIST